MTSEWRASVPSMAPRESHFGTRFEGKRFVPIRFDSGWAIWDRTRGRVVDGIYEVRSYAHDVADAANADPQGWDRDWLAGGYWKITGTPWEQTL